MLKHSFPTSVLRFAFRATCAAALDTARYWTPAAPSPRAGPVEGAAAWGTGAALMGGAAA